MRNEMEMEELLALAVASESDESPGSPSAAGCLAMSRLAHLTDPTPAEAEHLGSCRACAARRQAFAEPGATPRPRTPRLALLALAAAVLIVLLVPGERQREPSPGDQPPGPVELAGQPPAVCIDYLSRGEQASNGRTAAFRLSSDESCVMVAFLRAWNDDCSCLAWRVHSFGGETEPGAIQSRLDPGAPVRMDITLGAAPPVEQLLLVVTARSAEDLPQEASEAAELFACLGATGRCADEEAWTAGCLEAAPECLSGEVAVTGQSFVLR